MNEIKFNVIDLFAGVGGLSLGAARAGFQVKLAIEFDDHAITAHKLNFPSTKHWKKDVSELSGIQLLDYAGIGKGQLDGLIGGPPCQGFSTIGKRCVTDSRNHLFIRFLSIVEQSQPKFFLVENVPGILDQKYDCIRQAAFEHVERDYKILGPLILKASDYGAPTSRERVFYIGYHKAIINYIKLHDMESKKIKIPVTVAEAFYGLPAIRSSWILEEQSWRKVKNMPDSSYGNCITDLIPESVGNEETIELYHQDHIVSGNFGTRHSNVVKARYNMLKPGERDKISKSVRLDLNSQCPTLRAGTDSEHGSYQAVRPIHPTMPRVITPREAARLQGFPDWFRFDSTKWHTFRLIGNSVSPILSQAIFEVIYSNMELSD